MLSGVWQQTTSYLAAVGAYARLIKDVIVVSIRRPPKWELVRDQFYQIGVLSLPVVAMTGLSTGLILATQAYYQLRDMGLSGTTGLFVGKSMVTELGPVLTAFMVTGRVGAAMCAQLGTMQVTEQIDALKSMAVNPLRYLVAPRFLAGTFMLPPLTAFSTTLGIVGGYLMAVSFFGLPSATYLDPIPVHISNFDVVSGMIKALVFGVIISTISCYKGLTTTGGAAGVGRSTTTSVVVCYTVILFSNFVLNVALHLVKQTIWPWK